MRPAFFPTQDCPLGKRGETVQGSRTICAYDSIGQDPVVECDINAVVISVKSYGFYIDVCVQKLSTPNSGVGGRIQNGLRAGG